jgi:hypothetical protein
MRYTVFIIALGLITTLTGQRLLTASRAFPARAMGEPELKAIVAGACPCCRKVVGSTCWSSTNGNCTGQGAKCGGACGEPNCRKQATPIAICADWPNHPKSGCSLSGTTDCGDQYTDGVCKTDSDGCFCYAGFKVAGGCNKQPSAAACTPP